MRLSKLTKEIKSIKRLLVLTLVGLALPSAALADDVPPPHRQPELPPPLEIRDYHPINHMMAVEYADGREFLFRVVAVKPRSDCNQVQFDEARRIITIITQATSNAFEYRLEPLPVMTSEWVAWSK